MKSGDILGGIASSTNTVTGVISGLASNQGTKLPLSAVNADNTVGKDNLKAAQATNNFYANVGVNLGFNKSSSNSNSHSETGVVTTIRGKDENSSIIYNNVKNVEYVGTQAQDTKFIYNNVENINKRAVELKNSVAAIIPIILVDKSSSSPVIRSYPNILSVTPFETPKIERSITALNSVCVPSP